MTNKEKEKLWLGIVKVNAKRMGWKFSGYFAFTVIDNVFYSASFDVHYNKDVITLNLQSKPFELDNLFWKIIDEEDNIKSPLSFRHNAAFQVTPLTLIRKEFNIDDKENPTKGIEEIFDELINFNFSSPYTNEALMRRFIKATKADNFYAVSVITSLLYLNEFDAAIEEIEEYRRNNIRPRYTFGEEDFFDLALTYVKKHH